MRATIVGRLGLFAWSDVADGQMAREEPNIWIIKRAWALISSCCLSWSQMRHTGFDKERKACKPPGRWERGYGGVTSTKRGQQGKAIGGEKEASREGRSFFFCLAFSEKLSSVNDKEAGWMSMHKRETGGWVRILISAMSPPPLRASFGEREGNPSEQQATTKMKIKCFCSAERDKT